MTERHDESSAAWRAAHRWQARARQARPSTHTSGFKLILTWLMVGTMMVVGTLFALFFLLLGWLMMPVVRHRMKKRMEQMRADQARDVGPGFDQPRHSSDGHRVLEGDYQVRK